MESATSLSKGCFTFVPKSMKNRRYKKSAVQDEFEPFYKIPQIAVYSSMIKKIEDCLKDINNNASDEVLQDLVKFVSKCQASEFAIPTAVLLTGVNLPDHNVMFQAIAGQLKDEVTQNVAVLPSSDCNSVKNTIELLSSQFLKQSTLSLDAEGELEDESDEEDAFDDLKRSQCTMPNVVSWYQELEKQPPSPKKRKTLSAPEKLVIIVPDFEGFSSKIMQDFILILSGYLDRLPLVLLFGVATSVKALQSCLPHRVTSRMDLHMFQSKNSVHFLNKTIHEVFLSWKDKDLCPFLLGPNIFKFLTDVFLYYDFSVHGFIQGVKYCLMDHFFKNPLSKLCCPRDLLQQTVKDLTTQDLTAVGNTNNFRTHLENLPKGKVEKILQSEKAFKEKVLELMERLHSDKEQRQVLVWLLHSLVHDLPGAPLGKQVREVYVEVMSGAVADHPRFSRCFELLNFLSKQELLEKIDNMKELLDESGCLEDVLSELEEMKESVEQAGQHTKSPMSSPSKRTMKTEIQTVARSSPGISRKQFMQTLQEKYSKPQENEFEKARSRLLHYLKKDVFEKYLVAFSSLPLYEVMFINDMSTKRHVVGAPRAALHLALNNPHHYLQCDCCKISSSGEILPTMPDICVAYKLHLESSGTLINMYDWLQSFVTVVSPNDENVDEKNVDPAIQARFTRAVSELQFLGFIKASKKKADHVARLTWGSTC